MSEEEAAPIALLPMDLQHLSKGALRILSQDPNMEPSLLEQILSLKKEDMEMVRCLIRNPSLPDESFFRVIPDLSEELRQEINARDKSLISVADHGVVRHGVKRSGDPKAHSEVEGNIQKRIQKMSPVEKICVALKGPKEARGILIRDPNKDVALTVLKNPKISESEIEYYATSTNVVEDIHREIGKNREWCKNYSILRALVFNPKTPVGISLERLPYVKDKDLQFLSKSKNVPSAVRSGAKRLVAKKQRKKG